MQRELKKKHRGPVRRLKRGTQRSSAKIIEERNTEVQCEENRREKHRGPMQRESGSEKHRGPVQRKPKRKTKRSSAQRIKRNTEVQ